MYQNVATYRMREVLADVCPLIRNQFPAQAAIVDVLESRTVRAIEDIAASAESLAAKHRISEKVFREAYKDIRNWLDAYYLRRNVVAKLMLKKYEGRPPKSQAQHLRYRFYLEPNGAHPALHVHKLWQPLCSYTGGPSNVYALHPGDRSGYLPAIQEFTKALGVLGCAVSAASAKQASPETESAHQLLVGHDGNNPRLAEMKIRDIRSHDRHVLFVRTRQGDQSLTQTCVLSGDTVAGSKVLTHLSSEPRAGQLLASLGIRTEELLPDTFDILFHVAEEPWALPRVIGTNLPTRKPPQSLAGPSVIAAVS